MRALTVVCSLLLLGGFGCEPGASPYEPMPMGTPPTDTSGAASADGISGAPDGTSARPDVGPVAPDTAGSSDAPAADPPGPSPAGPACVLGELSDYPSCCDHAPARCVPTDQVQGDLLGLFDPCDEGAVCVAESLFTKSGTYTNAGCVSVLGVAGACTTKCSPALGGFLDALPQDVCDAGEVCAPCVSPLDGQETGACDPFECTGEYGGAGEPAEPPAPAASCDNLPDAPLVDVGLFPTCCDGARCVPESLVGAELAASLESCDGGVCVPEEFVASAGLFKPMVCDGPGGEGRCLSMCIPFVAESAALLPQDICQPNERCAPCCDPITGDNTGACDVGCDAWTEDGGVCEVSFDLCCDGSGHCLPEAIIPEADLANVEEAGCGTGHRCVPDELVDPDFQPLTCDNTLVIPFVAEFPYEGICLSKCLKIPLDFLIWSGTCPSTHDCVPCTDFLTGQSTGAPGC